MKSMLPILLILTMVSAGCLTPEPRFDLDSSPKLDFNPLSFEALKLWNSTNQETRTVSLDSCNNAVRVGDDGFTWQVTLNNC